MTQIKNQSETFNLKQWLARESVNDKIMPDEYFPDLDNHPFFKRKLEEAKEFFTKHPIPDHPTCTQSG